jgi:4-amino-4-deoxy-L-arabinose transferase-like glycosyltransferase
LAFVRQRSDRISGFVAALIGATMLGISIIGRGAIADALLNLLLALTMFDMYRYMETPERRYRYRVYAWMGLGMLTKGPIALLIPLAVGTIVFFAYGKRQAWWKAVFDPVGWMIFLAIAGPWYALEYRQHGQAFIDGFFLHHNVERFRNPMQGHGGGVLYYLPVLLFLLLPYSGLFIRILPTLRSIRRHSLSGFLWTWFLFVLVFFSLSGTKLPHYLLYGVTPLVILMALHRHRLQSAWLAFFPPFFLACLALGLPTLLQFAAPRIDNRYFQEMLSRQEVFGTSYFLAALAMLAGIAALMLASRMAIWQRLVAMGLMTTAALGGAILPAVAELQQGPVKEAAAVARKTGKPVATWQITMPSFSVYLGAVTRPYVPPGRGELIFTRTDRMASLGPVETLYRKGGIALVRKPE